MSFARLAALAALALVSSAAHADYVCRQIDPPGQNGSQAWEGNSAGQLPGTADQSYLYSGGVFTPLPPPPAPLHDTSALGLNDFGELAGGINSGDSAQLGFIFQGGAWSTFAAPRPYDSSQ